jgi:hypothetical protein
MVYGWTTEMAVGARALNGTVARFLVRRTATPVVDEFWSNGDATSANALVSAYVHRE